MAYLETTPFESYLVPGLLLLIVVGFGHMLAGFALARRGQLGPFAAIGAGSALVTWIVTEMVLVRAPDPGIGATLVGRGLQVMYLVLGIAIIAAAVRRIIAASKPPESQGLRGSGREIRHGV